MSICGLDGGAVLWASPVLSRASGGFRWRSVAMRLPAILHPVLSSGGAGKAGDPPIAGKYVCASGCRATGAPPSIEINGGVAHCMNEFGGTFEGKLLSQRSVACFNKTGTSSADRTTILWDNGAVWRRH